MKVGIVGLGYWGPNLVRNFSANPDIEEVVVCDLRQERLNLIKEKFPACKSINSIEELFKLNLNIVAIATPVRTHYSIAKKALENNINVWLEKPFTSTSDEAKELIKIAEERNLKIFVDHTFIYTGAVKKLKEIIDAGELGDILYFDSVRINLGLFQHDVNVIWDLAPHDFSIMHYLLDKKVNAVSAHGIANYYDHANLAHVSLHFKDNCFAHFHVNWTSPVKIRKMLIGGSKKMVVFDDMENFEKIKIYDSGIEMKNDESIHQALIQYRIGDMYSPKVLQTEALALGVKEFISAIRENRQPLTNCYDGLKVVKILEAADKSIHQDGKLIEI